MILFLFTQLTVFKSKTGGGGGGGMEKVFEILPISVFQGESLILRLIFLMEIKRIRVNLCLRLIVLQ